MEFVIEKETLINMLNWVSKTLLPRPVLIEQSGIEIEAKDGKIKVITTNTESVAKAEEILAVSKEGRILVPGSAFIEVIKAMPNEKIEIKEIDNRIKVSTAKANFTLPLIKEKPLISTIEEGEKITEIDIKQTKKALSQTAVAAAKEEASAQLTAIKTTLEENKITFVALDRYRIAKKEIVSTEKIKEKQEMLIKAKTFIDVLNALENKEKIEIFKSNENVKKIRFKIGDYELQTQEVGGIFPETNPLFNEEYTTTIKINKKEIEDALNRATTIAKKIPNVEIEINENKIRVFQTEDDKSSEEEIKAEVSGDLQKTKFNLNYLKEGISQIEDEKIIMEFNGTKPVKITGEKTKNEYIYIIVPIRQ